MEVSSLQEKEDLCTVFKLFGIFINGVRCPVVPSDVFVSLYLRPGKWFTQLSTMIDVQHQLERAWGTYFVSVSVSGPLFPSVITCNLHGVIDAPSGRGAQSHQIKCP